MTQVYPQTLAFDDTATPAGGWHCGYARILPWGASAEGGSGDSIVSSVGDLSSAYSVSPGSPKRASVMGLGTPGTGMSHFVWSKDYLANAEVRAAVFWKPSPSLGVTGFRYAMIGVRIAGQSINDSTPGFERLENGNGYWLELRSTASANTAKWILLRVNSGSVTKITESSLFDISALNLTAGIIMSLRATTSGGNAVLRCQRAPVGKFGMEAPDFVDVFGADVTDSSGSKLTAAGRCGLGTTQPPTGGATLFGAFQIKNADTNTVVLCDEWERANYAVGGSVGPDANTLAARNLLPYFGGSIGGYTGVNRRLARDAGNNRMRNDSTVGVAWDCPMAVAATHPAIQRRWGHVTFSTPSGQVDTLAIELRGSGLHGVGAPTNACYRAEIECTDGTAFVAKLCSYAGGLRTDLASKTLSGPATGTPVKFEFETVNTGGATALVGTPNLILRVDDVVVTGWTLAAVTGISQLASGVVLDSRSSAIRTGYEVGHRYRRGSLTVGTILFDNWTDAATLPEVGFNDLATVSMASETVGATGTLSIPISWRVEELPRFPSLAHPYEDDFTQTFPIGSRFRRRWKVEIPNSREAAATTLLDFYDDHGGVEIPFNWITPDGDSAVVAFVSDDLPKKLRDADVYGAEFELEERFA